MRTDSAQKIAEKIFAHSDLSTRQKVLEIGCGDGRISRLLIDRFEQLVAIDPDAASISTARRAAPDVDFQLGSGEQLAFPDNSFDLIVFTLSLHHQDSNKALIEAQRVLAASGQIMVVEPLPDGEVEQVFAFVHDENQAKSDAQQAIRASGLRLERTEEFTAEWWFDNEADLHDWLFSYYQIPFDEKTARKISTFVTEKLDHGPIVLEDRMTLQVLKKETPTGVET